MYNVDTMEVGLRALADFASVTGDGKLNVMGVFGEINPPKLPFVLPQMFVVVVYEASLAEGGLEKESKIVLLDADGNEIISLEQTIRVPEPKRPGMQIAANQIVGLAGLKFEKHGDYQFSFLIDGDEKGTLSLRVNSPDAGGGTSNA